MSTAEMEALRQLEGLCANYRQVMDRIRELDAEKEELKRQILRRLPTDRVSTPHFKIARMRSVRVNTSVESARSLGCTQQQEVVDKKKLKELHQHGVPVPDVAESEWVKVTVVQ